MHLDRLLSCRWTRQQMKGLLGMDAAPWIQAPLFCCFFLLFFFTLRTFELAVAAFMTHGVVIALSALWCDSCLEEFYCWLWCREIYLGPTWQRLPCRCVCSVRLFRGPRPRIAVSLTQTHNTHIGVTLFVVFLSLPCGSSALCLTICWGSAKLGRVWGADTVETCAFAVMSTRAHSRTRTFHCLAIRHWEQGEKLFESEF